MSEYLCVLTGYVCWVCGNEITEEDPHTYHAEGCPVRESDPCRVSVDVACTNHNGCGEDCHPSCCPTCTGQAF